MGVTRLSPTSGALGCGCKRTQQWEISFPCRLRAPPRRTYHGEYPSWDRGCKQASRLQRRLQNTPTQRCISDLWQAFTIFTRAVRWSARGPGRSSTGARTTKAGKGRRRAGTDGYRRHRLPSSLATVALEPGSNARAALSWLAGRHGVKRQPRGFSVGQACYPFRVNSRISGHLNPDSPDELRSGDAIALFC